MDAASISERFLHLLPACSWVVDAEYRFVRAEKARAWHDRVARCLAGETLLLRERDGAATWYLLLFPLGCREGAPGCAGGFAIDITPWSTAEQELRYTVLGALRAQEYARSTMSRFLHDSVGQNLSAAGMQLDLLRMDLETVAPESCARIGEIQQMLESMMQEVREFSYEVNPAMVERAGLHPALDRLVGKLRGRFNGTLRLIFDPSTKVEARYATALYHIAQEAVENALQHSACSLIEIAVKSSRTGPSLEVRDNGRGFDPADVLGGRRGLGLLTMDHFAAQAGLDVSISSTRDQGTVVRAAAPGGPGL